MTFDPGAFKREVADLEYLLKQAENGEYVVVPDGTIEAVKVLRESLSRALGPQEGADLIPLFRQLSADMDATRRHAFMARLGMKLRR